MRRECLVLGICALYLFLSASGIAGASDTNGVIDANYKYAWGENTGWINFGCDNCDVAVTDNGLSGYAWSSQYGWINLSPDTGGVANDGKGILSGYAWSSNLGWINFSGVTISNAGDFSGYATVETGGKRISFNCANGDSCSSADFKVKTDWRPASMRQTGGASGSKRSLPAAAIDSGAGTISPVNVPEIISSIVKQISRIFGPEKEAPAVAEKAPPALAGKWNLLPDSSIRAFVFAPLPYEIRVLASKFPELDKTFKSVGIERMSDVGKLAGVNLSIPDLATILDTTIEKVGLEKIPEIDNLRGVALKVPGFSPEEKLKGSVGAGRIALIPGLPVAKFPQVAKKNLPTEFVFARTGGELVDLSVAMSVSEKGEVSQKISSLPGKTMRLVVKPISKVRSVTGYFAFREAAPKVSASEFRRESLMASALFSMEDLVEKKPDPRAAEKKLILSSFDYEDPDKDGIYTADVVAPSVPGEYEIITLIEYVDPSLGTRQMRMITVIDPEGYVYEKNGGKETRIPSAIVSLYVLNASTKEYELWKADEYQQENPQVTDIRGTYSFLVPEGSYYMEVEAPGYKPYKGKVFVVSGGNGVHQNIEMTSSEGWLSALDWKTVMLIVIFILLIYNLISRRNGKQ